MTDPAAYPRRMLLAVTGLSPQIVTETVYALAVDHRPRWVPTEVRIITTRQGAEKARRTLLSEEPGWFRRLRADYGLPEIAFDAESIRVIDGPDGRPLDDILDEAHNAAVADFITEEVRALTADPNASLHVSIAGGRKTMGFYVGYALSLFGREQDRLSHVLVPPSFESRPDFYYPPPPFPPPQSPGRARGGEGQGGGEAHVHLGPIPFVRLREGLPDRLLAGGARFSEAVSEAQKALPPVRLHLDPATQTVTAGGEAIDLKPAELAFYLMLAQRRKKRRPGAHWSDKQLQAEILESYARVVNANSAEYERFESAGMSKDNFNARKSKINAALFRTLGKRLAEPYLVEALEPLTGKGQSRFRPYGLRLPPEAITIAAVSLRRRHTRLAGSK
jgi:CRISPR-associated protein (TIGR02584 family)